MGNCCLQSKFLSAEREDQKQQGTEAVHDIAGDTGEKPLKSPSDLREEAPPKMTAET